MIAVEKITESELQSSNERITWKEYFKEISTITAKRSCCSRLQVGCVLVKDNRIISQGYNGFLPGFPHESIIKDGHEVATIHAEQNTIIDCAKRGVSCEGCHAYITHFPCLTCTKILIAAGIKKYIIYTITITMKQYLTFYMIGLLVKEKEAFLSRKYKLI